MKKNTKRLLVFIVVTVLLFALAACSTVEKKYVYNYVGGEDIIVDGTRGEGEGAFDNVGIYTEPELDIDGVRDSHYDFPTGSGRRAVYIDGSEDTYVSIYKGETAIYFLFECKDEYLSALSVEDVNISTAQSDSVELYVSTYGAGGRTRTATDYEFRMTVASRIYSYLTGFVAKVFPYGTINNTRDKDEGFNVEGYISYAVLGADVNKNTPTSFAFARVTKTGTTGYVWHGAVDPQIPDNYLTLHTDNKFYKIDECPRSVKLHGTVVDIDNNPLPLVGVVSPLGVMGYTDSDGRYEVSFDDATEFGLSFEKKGYLTYEKTFDRQQFINVTEIEYNQALLKESDSAYATTFGGTITERDGTPIKNAKIKLGESSAVTDENGEYTFAATCDGYVNTLVFEADNHIAYSREIEFSDVAINGDTAVGAVALDESYGSTVSFGNKSVGFADARILRSADNKSFKVVFKTAAKMDGEGCNFELFIDTKASSAFDRRDGSDYRLDISYNDGLIEFKNYGNLSMPRTGFTSKSGRLNELYYIEADIDYAYIGVQPTEIIGLYFGIKCDYLWAGMYDGKNEYIKAEYPRNYIRLDTDSSTFMASSNTEPAPAQNAVPLGEIGNYANFPNAVKYGVSIYRDDEGVMLVFEQKTAGIEMSNQPHSLNVYLDTNYTAGKNKMSVDCYHLSIYPGKPVASYRSYDKNGNELNSAVYEEDTEKRFEIRYKNKIYVRLAYEVFGGSADNVIGVAVGCWNDGANGNDVLKYNGKTPEFNNPVSFIKIDGSGQTTIGG